MNGRWLPTLIVAGSLLAAITTGRLKMRTSPRSAAAVKVASMSSPVMCVAWTMRSVRPSPAWDALTVVWLPLTVAGGIEAPTPKLKLLSRRSDVSRVDAPFDLGDIRNDRRKPGNLAKDHPGHGRIVAPQRIEHRARRREGERARDSVVEVEVGA